jgi:hypothetical protein
MSLQISERLFIVLASGGTLEECLTKMPAFRQEIEAAFEQLNRNALTRSCDLRQLAQQYGKAIRTKDIAVKKYDWPTAADMRSEECNIIESLELKEPDGAWMKVMEVGVDDQIRDLSSLLTEMQGSKCEPGAAPNTAPPNR